MKWEKEMLMKEKQRKSMEFIEQDENFIKKFCSDIGCYYTKSNKITFNLSTTDSPVPGKMGVFAWVHKEEKDYFWVATRKMWLDEARVTSCNTHFPPNMQDGDCISFDTKDNYQDTVRVMKLINIKH
jgi:hypothetical protein